MNLGVQNDQMTIQALRSIDPDYFEGQVAVEVISEIDDNDIYERFLLFIDGQIFAYGNTMGQLHSSITEDCGFNDLEYDFLIDCKYNKKVSFKIESKLTVFPKGEDAQESYEMVFDGMNP